MLKVFQKWLSRKGQPSISQSSAAANSPIFADVAGPVSVTYCGSSDTFQGPVYLGLQGEEIASLLQAAGVAQQAEIKDLAAKLNTSREAVLGFLRILKEDEVPEDQLATKLALIAERHVNQLERLAALDPEDTDARRYIDEARKVIALAATSTDYHRADELLFMAEEAQDRTIQHAEALERDAHKAAIRLRYVKALTRAERAELSLSRLDYLQAGAHFRAVSELIPADNPERSRYLVKSADALQSYGYEKEDSAVLVQAVDIYRRVLSQTPPTDVEAGWDLQRDAIDAVIKSIRRHSPDLSGDLLEKYAEARLPLDWAATQYKLGNTLKLLGVLEKGTERLEEAVSAYRAALEQYSRNRGSWYWATTQAQLGSALQALGRQEGGTVRLEEAVKAYRAALEAYSRETDPMTWAHTQFALGLALRLIGEREEGTVRLEEAVKAFRSALEGLSNEREPKAWAAAHFQLGNVFKTMGMRESGTEMLQQAVNAYRTSLGGSSREHDPMQWAGTQLSLGNALQILGQRVSGTERLEEAADAIEMAWQGYKEARMYRMKSAYESRMKSIRDLIAARRSQS